MYRILSTLNYLWITKKNNKNSDIMLEYQKYSTHANTSTDYVYKNRANIIIYDLTRAKDVTKQSAKCMTIAICQNV